MEKFKPTTLIDIGANIGLSSLNLIGKFSSLKHIIAIEAEKENFSILENNFRLWKNYHEKLKFSQFNAVATNESGKKYL